MIDYKGDKKIYNFIRSVRWILFTGSLSTFILIPSVFLPIILLVYSSFSHFTLYKVVPYGKWAIMILVVYLMGWISWIFDESYFVYFIDLGIKIAIAFLPINIVLLQFIKELFDRNSNIKITSLDLV